MKDVFAAMFADARDRLAGAPREALGELIRPRRVLGIARAERIVPRGTAWHLGALLLTDTAVLATGDVVRSRQEVRRGYTAAAQRRRAELAAAARRGGFAEGETVHIGWRVLDTTDASGAASAPLAIVRGVPSVRWSAQGGYMPLRSYLDERIALLRDPPAGT